MNSDQSGQASRLSLKNVPRDRRHVRHQGPGRLRSCQELQVETELLYQETGEGGQADHCAGCNRGSGANVTQPQAEYLVGEADQSHDQAAGKP